MNEENITSEEPTTTKKSTRKPSKPVEAAVPEPARVNPIPGSPEIDGKFPGDDGYKYAAANKGIRDEVNVLKAKIEELQALSRAITSAQPAVKKSSSYDMWVAQKAIEANIRGEADAKKAQVAAVLKEMNLL
jgi:hypothetical protein